MENNHKHLENLNRKLSNLIERQESFDKDIKSIQKELNDLQESSTKSEVIEPFTKDPLEDIASMPQTEDKVLVEESPTIFKSTIKPQWTSPSEESNSAIKADIEKFVGENLISKIGILITIIGVFIGVKYSIEHDLISPAMRIVLGYLSGLILLGFGIKLKDKYLNYSAVLVSGAMSVMYFISYIAYSFYDLIPQLPTFILMLLFTCSTVYSALKYDKQIIAIIGLVGAYGIPFLLSQDSGKALILFSYITLINSGILYIAFRKRWVPLFITAFSVTWLIFLSWYLTSYSNSEHFFLGLGFLTVIFLMFYALVIIHLLRTEEDLKKSETFILLLNNLFFYAIGYSLLDGNTWSEYQGLFTLITAFIHAGIAYFIYQNVKEKTNLYYLTSGLALVFLTIAVPVQLDAHWVTIFWASEAALLFYIARSKGNSLFENLSLGLIVLTLYSLIHDWSFAYGNYNPDYPETRLNPILNSTYLASFIVTLAFAFINYVNKQNPRKRIEGRLLNLYRLRDIMLPAFLIVVTYLSFFLEINNYWNQLYLDSSITLMGMNNVYSESFINYDIRVFGSVWLINYSLLFTAILTFINIRWIKSRALGEAGIVMSAIAIYAFLIYGLYCFGELRESYLNQTLAEYYDIGLSNIWIRYISMIFLILALISSIHSFRNNYVKGLYRVAFELGIHLVLIWLMSSELINILVLSGEDSSVKLGMSILWGAYSVMMISLGIWKAKKYLRIGAIVLFAVTLAKLFLYDLANLETVSKTIVLVLLGVLLLIISFLYNKYKFKIEDVRNQNKSSDQES